MGPKKIWSHIWIFIGLQFHEKSIIQTLRTLVDNSSLIITLLKELTVDIMQKFELDFNKELALMWAHHHGPKEKRKSPLLNKNYASNSSLCPDK